MVLLTGTVFTRLRKSVNPDRFWRKRRILSLSAHFFGRRQNCFSIAIRNVYRALRYSTLSGRLRNRMKQRLYETRLDAACNEFKIPFSSLHQTLNDAHIGLDRKILQNLAIWEPRTFRSLTMLSKACVSKKGLNRFEDPPPPGVITRGML